VRAVLVEQVRGEVDLVAGPPAEEVHHRTAQVVPLRVHGSHLEQRVHTCDRLVHREAAGQAVLVGEHRLPHYPRHGAAQGGEVEHVVPRQFRQHLSYLVEEGEVAVGLAEADHAVLADQLHHAAQRERLVHTHRHLA
jgi:hypothetical protein